MSEPAADIRALPVPAHAEQPRKQTPAASAFDLMSPPLRLLAQMSRKLVLRVRNNQDLPWTSSAHAFAYVWRPLSPSPVQGVGRLGDDEVLPGAETDLIIEVPPGIPGRRVVASPGAGRAELWLIIRPCIRPRSLPHSGKLCRRFDQHRLRPCLALRRSTCRNRRSCPQRLAGDLAGP